jgi:hypothetical protein
MPFESVIGRAKTSDARTIVKANKKTAIPAHKKAECDRFPTLTLLNFSKGVFMLKYPPKTLQKKLATPPKYGVYSFSRQID